MIRALGSRKQWQWAQLACIGICVASSIGGVLNLFGLISRLSISLFVAAGLLCLPLKILRPAAASGGPRRRNWSGAARMVLAASLVLLAVRFLGAVVTTQSADTVYPAISVYDDSAAYLVFPEKMIQTGSMGTDPFSLRRTPSHTLGGAPFLKAMILAYLGPENVPLMDAGLGMVLVSGVLLGYLAELAVAPLLSALILLVFLLIPMPEWNTQPMVIPIALFVSLYRILAEEGDAESAPRAVLTGLHLAALASLKLSLVPAGVALVAAAYLLRLPYAPHRVRAVREGVVEALSCALFLLPWVIDVYRTTGHVAPISLANYHADPAFVRALNSLRSLRGLPFHFLELPPLPFLVIGGMLMLMRGANDRPRGERIAFASLLIAVLLGIIGVFVGMGGFNHIYRYVLPFVVAALLISVCRAACGLDKLRLSGESPLHAVLIAGILVGTMTGADLRYTLDIYAGAFRAMRHGAGGATLVSCDVARRYRDLQAAVPAGAVILTHLERPFLLDFKRNRIFILDFPGGAALSPGLPFYAGGDALAEYLTSKGIRYLAVGYRTDAGMRGMEATNSARATDRDSFAKTVAALTKDLDRNALELGGSRRRIYDDGFEFVVDLLQAPGGQPSIK